MTSPIETPQAAVNEEIKAAKKANEHVEIGGVRIPLPRWATFLIGIVAVIGAAFPVVKYLLPTAHADPITKADNTAVIQYREYQKHIAEAPEYTQKLFDSPDLGSLTVNFYGSDGCLLVMKKNPGRFDQAISYWIPKASIEADRAPGAIANHFFQPNSPARLLQSMEAQIAPASLVLANVAAATPVNNCLNPHPGEFRWWNGEVRGCWSAIWRQWGDGCQHYQWFNTCSGYWDSDQSGAPRVYWTNCNH
jgi:hypothetical protein